MARLNPTLGTITICPEYGMGAYATYGYPGRGLGLACVAADAIVGTPEAWGLSEALQADLAAWGWWHEAHVSKPGFDWDECNRRGLDLARRVKTEVGDRYNVGYFRDPYDPGYAEVYTLIEADRIVSFSAFARRQSVGEADSDPSPGT